MVSGIYRLCLINDTFPPIDKFTWIFQCNDTSILKCTYSFFWDLKVSSNGLVSNMLKTNLARKYFSCVFRSSQVNRILAKSPMQCSGALSKLNININCHDLLIYNYYFFIFFILICAMACTYILLRHVFNVYTWLGFPEWMSPMGSVDIPFSCNPNHHMMHTHYEVHFISLSCCFVCVLPLGGFQFQIRSAIADDKASKQCSMDHSMYATSQWEMALHR